MNQDSAAFLCAIRGPVMMITLGILFALDNFTPFGFSRTWPVLLVVAGILNLGTPAARARRRNRGQWVTPPMPAPSYAGPSGGPAPASSPSTAPPGSYRGSAYEETPGGSTARGAETKENREKPSSPPGGPQ